MTRQVCETDEEFAQALRELDRWNRDHGYGPAKIDPGLDPAIKAAFERLGGRGHAALKEALRNVA